MTAVKERKMLKLIFDAVFQKWKTMIGRNDISEMLAVKISTESCFQRRARALGDMPEEDRGGRPVHPSDSWFNVVFNIMFLDCIFGAPFAHLEKQTEKQHGASTSTVLNHSGKRHTAPRKPAQVRTHPMKQQITEVRYSWIVKGFLQQFRPDSNRTTRIALVYVQHRVNMLTFQPG